MISAQLPGLGFSTYTVSAKSTALPSLSRDTERESSESVGSDNDVQADLKAPVTISNNYLSLSFDPSSGLLSSMTNMVLNIMFVVFQVLHPLFILFLVTFPQISGVSISVTQNWFWYNSSVCGSGWSNSDNNCQTSGAYVSSL